MKTKIAWVHLHAPLFHFSGANLGDKLDPRVRQGLTMEYCEEQRHLYVSYNNATQRVPETTIISMVEASNVVALPKAQVPAPGPIEAQVETPTSHVFAGKGKGQTGLGSKVK